MNKKEDNNDKKEDGIYRCFNVGNNYPSLDVVEAIAELEGKKSSELPAIYDTIGPLIKNLFSNPPSSEAEAVLQFSYEGYRITLNQNSSERCMKITDENKEVLSK